MISIKKRVAIVGVLLSFLQMPVYADFEDLLGTFSSELEERSAQAALRTYQRLRDEAGCTDSQRVDNVPGDGAALPNAAPLCAGRVFRVFQNLRELVHTGNQLSRSGPTEFSLRLSLEALGSALRWLAAEEYAAQGNMSSDFVNGQVSGLSTRLSALRLGAQGFSFSHHGVWPTNGEYAGVYGTEGGAAGESYYSPWGGFLNVQSSTGSRDGTGLEGAFDLASFTANAGVDYRLNDQWIIGALLGYSQQEIDFDASQSVVDGYIESDGYSIMPFFMYQQGSFYLSGSLGLQQLDFDSLREIQYTSLNPSLPSTDTQTLSETSANIQSLFVEAGYTFNWRKLGLEPYINVNVSNVVIDEFREEDANNAAFDLVVKEQSIDTLDMTVGAKLQYTLTPKSGVYTPYFAVETVRQSETDSRDIEAYYSGLGSDETLFAIPTEVLDGNYQTVSFGLSSVLRGGRELTSGGRVGGDVQAYFTVKTVTGLEGFDLTFYSLGLRYAF